MIKPVGHRVLIKADSVEEKTEGGIILAKKTVQDASLGQIYGTIVAIGSQCWKEIGDGSPWAAIGDRVCFAKYSGLRVRESVDSEETFVLVNDEDVTAVIYPEED